MARRRLTLVAALALLSVLGVIGLATLAIAGPEPRARWGYLAATTAFVLGAAQLAPVLAFVSRLGRGFWGAPLRRVADLFGLAGLVTAPLLIVLLQQLPDWPGRPSIWSDWPGAPRVWDAIAAVALALTGAGLVWLTSRPDRHPARWSGATRQWRVLTSGVVAMGAFYTMLAVFVHLLVSSDLALSLVPGWHSAVIPAYHVVSGFEAAVALVIVVTAMVRPEAHLQTFRASAKLLLALALLWFYFVWCELLTYWYGRTPDEQGLLGLFMFGPGAGLFLVAAVCEFVAPVLVLMWAGARAHTGVVAGVAAMVVVGSYVDRLRLYLGAWSVATPRAEEHLPDRLPPLPPPGLPETAACVGTLALVALVLLVVVRRVPSVSAWEIRAVERLVRERRLLRTRVSVVGRPS
jgi:molybdopterin-containing oxidoreductase family membrane subunit